MLDRELPHPFTYQSPRPNASSSRDVKARRKCFSQHQHGFSHHGCAILATRRIDTLSCSDAQQGDTTVTPPSGVSWLSSGDIETPLTTDEYAPRRTTVAQRPKAEEGSQRTVVGSSETLSPTSEHDVWSDYILPEYLFPSETIQFGNSQDFSCILTPQKSCQGTLSSASPDVQPLSLLAREAVAGLDFMDVVEPHHFEIMDTVFQENGNTESALPVLPSNRWVFDPGPSSR